MSEKKQGGGLRRKGTLLSYYIGRLWLKLFGWKIYGAAPSYSKFVFIAAPHTSNWDLPFMLATAYAMRVRISWFGKHTLFIFPWGWLMRRLGGIPVDRRAPQSLVIQTAENLKTAIIWFWLFRRKEPEVKWPFGSRAFIILRLRVECR